MAPVIAALDRLDELTVPALHHVTQHGVCLALSLVGVAPQSRGKGIANKLAELSVLLAKENNYQLLHSQCTSAFSQAMMRKLGFREVAQVEYGEFEWQGERVFEQAARGTHQRMIAFVKEL